MRTDNRKQIKKEKETKNNHKGHGEKIKKRKNF